MAAKEVSQDNKRIAKNTVFLYLRMLLLTAINIYTVKITFNILGEEDYGIYNVVASLVGSMGFLTGTMTSATQRFLSFHLGKGDMKTFNKTFCILFWSFVILSLGCILIGEGFGLIFLEHVLNIPVEKMFAAKIVFQTALVIFIMSMMTIPYNAAIIAHEDMGIFAYFTVIDGVLKLLLVYGLILEPNDHLILYGVLMALESVVMYVIYWLYCRNKYAHCRIRMVWEKGLFVELSSYTGWNLFGSISNVLCNQGQNLILNYFFGPLVNAAKSIGDRIQHTTQSFATNFYMAVSPQIVKSYAKNDLERAFQLVMTSSRLSFFLLAALVFPLIVVMPKILWYWLGEGSGNQWMTGFSRLALLFVLVNSLEQPITQLIRATGKIKKYQINVGIFTLSYIPIIWVLLKVGFDAFSTMVVLILLYMFVMIIRVRIANKQVGMSVDEYLKSVIWPILKVCVVGAPLYWWITRYQDVTTFGGMVLLFIAAFIAIGATIYILGLTKSDRGVLLKFISNKFHRNGHHNNPQA